MRNLGQSIMTIIAEKRMISPLVRQLWLAPKLRGPSLKAGRLKAGLTHDRLVWAGRLVPCAGLRIRERAERGPGRRAGHPGRDRSGFRLRQTITAEAGPDGPLLISPGPSPAARAASAAMTLSAARPPRPVHQSSR